jgi:hypothetical protein
VIDYTLHMRRVACVVIKAYCPVHVRTVEVQRNTATDQLVHCASQDGCATEEEPVPGVTVKVYPSTCPVHRRPA